MVSITIVRIKERDGVFRDHIVSVLIFIRYGFGSVLQFRRPLGRHTNGVMRRKDTKSRADRQRAARKPIQRPLNPLGCFQYVNPRAK